MFIASCLKDYDIPFDESIDTDAYGDRIVTQYIPNSENALISIRYNSSDPCGYILTFTKIYPSGSIRKLSERETIEFVILYLLWTNSPILERVLYTPIHVKSMEAILTNIIANGILNNESADLIADKIIEYGLVYDVREILSNTVKELTSYDN